MIDDGLTTHERLEQFVSQAYKDDSRSLLHVHRVAQKCVTPSERIVALAHDLIEDGKASFNMLRDIGLSQDEAWAVFLLTRKDKNESYIHYIRSILLAWETGDEAAAIALAVKYNDLTDHLRPATLSNITETHAMRYVDALAQIVKTCTNKQKQATRQAAREAQFGDGTTETSSRENRISPSPLG